MCHPHFFNSTVNFMQKIIQLNTGSNNYARLINLVEVVVCSLVLPINQIKIRN